MDWLGGQLERRTDRLRRGRERERMDRGAADESGQRMPAKMAGASVDRLRS